VLDSLLAPHDILGPLAEYEVGDVPLRPSGLDSSMAGEDAVDVEQSA